MRKPSRPRHRIAFRDNYLAAIGIAVFLLSSFCANAQIFQYPNPGTFGTGEHRRAPDSTLYFPTGCGVPTDSTYLRSYGFNGHGQIVKQAAKYYDSCGHHEYVWDPALKAWQITGSGSAGSSFSLRPITSANFDTGILDTGLDCPIPALNGDSLQIFWNDLNRFLIEGVEWSPLPGGGFSISVPGFDAKTTDYSLTLYSNTGSTSPGPLPVTSTSFSTGVDCPLPALNGMALNIFWNDANRYLTQGVDWTPLAGGGMTILIPGFNATTTNYSFFIFNQ